MTIKAQTRVRVQVQTEREYIERDEHLLCQTEGCRNVIAVWALRRRDIPICSRCRRD